MDRLWLPALIGDGMVLQQGVPLPLWGTARPHTPVTLVFLGESYRAESDAQGGWRIVVAPLRPGGPYIMEFSSAGETVRIGDVYSGDVWLCSGQSNMELPMERLRDDFPEEWRLPVNRLIRQFLVPQEWEFSGPRRELSGGVWAAASKETLKDFSGTGWFFAKKMYENHGVPMGLITAAWGGTPIESWMSREALAGFPEIMARGARYADAAYRDGLVKESQDAVARWAEKADREDAGLREKWYLNETDDSRWETLSLPGDFSEAGMEGFCGVVWLRRAFDVPPSLAGKEARIWLGTVVDADTVYVNGTAIGGVTYRYPPRKYDLPAGLLREGENRITIRVICNNGQGGITRGKPFRLFSEHCAVELAGSWKYKTGMSAAARPAEFFPHYQPMGLYNAMIAPLLNFPVRGVIWYQGESNDSAPQNYGALFTAMIRDWRDKYRREALPFLFVQLPLYGLPGKNTETSSWALLREAQASALALPATGMAAALDLGEWNDLHPVNKKDVGYRLAMSAERLLYNRANTAPGPMPRSLRLQDGTITIAFDNCGEGLTSDGTPYISIVSQEGAFRLPAVITGPDRLSIDVSSVKSPEKALYAWADNPADRSLYNAEGLPVIPFRIHLRACGSL
ncbi:MAG: 9-O-acetylesterase [Treponema sp.]|jgi:sialate O-acetylesterase|nr:9-O-acetylesterase [Treponema sp.]